MTDDWRKDRIGAALRGENPTVLRRLDAAFAVGLDSAFAVSLDSAFAVIGDEPDRPRAAV